MYLYVVIDMLYGETLYKGLDKDKATEIAEYNEFAFVFTYSCNENN